MKAYLYISIELEGDYETDVPIATLSTMLKVLREDIVQHPERTPVTAILPVKIGRKHVGKADLTIED